MKLSEILPIDVAALRTFRSKKVWMYTTKSDKKHPRQGGSVFAFRFMIRFRLPSL